MEHRVKMFTSDWINILLNWNLQFEYYEIQMKKYKFSICKFEPELKYLLNNLEMLFFL